jgi:hypothetical protein
VRSNSALGMDVCQYLCYSVQEDALCLTDWLTDWLTDPTDRPSIEGVLQFIWRMI